MPQPAGHTLLVVFVKNIRKGTVKTRLSEELGEEKALDIYTRLLEHTRETAREVEVERQVWFSERIPEHPAWPPAEFTFRVQKGADLGERMALAFAGGFKAGYTRIVLIGSDCAEINPGIIDEAFSLLEDADAVLGPARDGGYYLIGLRSPAPELFAGIPWSTGRVLEQTKDKMEHRNMTYSVLPELGDIDTAEDWRRFKEQSGVKWT